MNQKFRIKSASGPSVDQCVRGHAVTSVLRAEDGRLRDRDQHLGRYNAGKTRSSVRRGRLLPGSVPMFVGTCWFKTNVR